METETKILPCECGAPGKLEPSYIGYAVFCDEYDGPETPCYASWGKTKEEAIDDWNRYQEEEAWP